MFGIATSNGLMSQRCGELIVKHLLAGDRGHYGPIEHPQITLMLATFLTR
jgi:thymidylate synthase (FAD)